MDLLTSFGGMRRGLEVCPVMGPPVLQLQNQLMAYPDFQVCPPEDTTEKSVRVRHTPPPEGGVYSSVPSQHSVRHVLHAKICLLIGDLCTENSNKSVALQKSLHQCWLQANQIMNERLTAVGLPSLEYDQVGVVLELLEAWAMAEGVDEHFTGTFKVS